MMARARKSGFTLVELLVVIGIIALLAALLLPVLAKATMSAKATRCRSKLTQYYQGVRMYLNNYDEFFPTAWHASTGSVSADLGDLAFHRFAIHEYCETNFKRTYDPATDTETVIDKFKRDQAFWEDPGAGWTKDYFAPTIVFKGPMNGNDINLTDASPFDKHAQYNEVTKDVASTERPMLTEVNVSFANTAAKDSKDSAHQAEMISGWCLAAGPAGIGPTGNTGKAFVGVGPSSRAISGTDHLVADELQSRFDMRHNDSSNILFTDAHVESVSGTSMERWHRIHERWNNLVPGN